MKTKSQVSFVKTKMADRHLPQHVKDVPISALLDRDFPITTLMLCEVNSEVRTLYTFTISSLKDVSTTWRTHSSPPPALGCSQMLSDVCGQFNLQHHLLWSSGYFGYLAFTISGTIYSLALGVKKGPGERGHGDTGRREDRRDKQGCATMKSSSYYCTALGSSPQPQTSSCISCSHLSYLTLYLV